MKIAILSGKGGTGKTTVSTNLAQIMRLNYVDCDVEEPNGYIFLKPVIQKTEEVFIPVPLIDSDVCTLCGKCADSCQFNALARTMSNVLFFEELCHGCGACTIVCPALAIEEVNRPIGNISTGEYESLNFMDGKLNIKEPMAGPIISKLKKSIPEGIDTIIDCAPGTSCNVVKALEDTDYAILVTEPTKFGLHDLKLAVKLVRNMQIPFGIIINRSDETVNMIKVYCETETIDLIGEIPFSRRVAEMYSNGLLLTKDLEFGKIFHEIASNLRNLIDSEVEQAGDACK